MAAPADLVLQPGGLVRAGLPVVNFVLMLGIGMALAARDFMRVAARPRGLLLGVAGHYLALPLIGLCFALLFASSYELAVGFILLAASPSANSSNALTWLARGNLALAVSLTAASSLLTLLTIPLLTGAALQLFAGQAQPIVLPVRQMTVHLALLVLLPLLLGMSARQLWPGACRRLEPWLNRASMSLLLLLIVLIVVDQWHVLKPWMGRLALATTAMCVLAMLAGGALARLGRLDRQDTVTLSLEVGVQNCTLAFLIAYNVLQSATVGMPAAVYGVTMYFVAFAFVLASRLRQAGARAAAA